MSKFLTAVVAVVAVGVAGGTATANPDDWRLGVKISASPGGGVRIHEVFPGSPAEQAGLRSGMILLTVDGVLYNDPLAVRDKLMFHSGDVVNLVYQDGAAFYQVTAQLTTVTVAAVVTETYGGKTVQKTVPKVVPKLKDVKRVQVPDPRKKK
jgi:S1-C subfamily serine protease